MWKWFKRDTKKKEQDLVFNYLTMMEKKQSFTNIRLVSFSIIGIIATIKEKTWDKDLCDDILSEAQDLTTYYMDCYGAMKKLEALMTDITALAENVNETDNETLLALGKHLFNQICAIKNLEE